jgi:hypothetical protein
MSDATDREDALTDLARLVQIDVEPTIEASELDEILDKYKRASRWVTATTLVYGDVIMPTAKNGHRYMVTEAGTTTTEPAWPTVEGDSVTAGATFQEIGGDYDNIYDVRGAAKEVWEIKRAKAAEMVSNPVSGAEGQIFENCDRMVRRYGRPLIA